MSTRSSSIRYPIALRQLALFTVALLLWHAPAAAVESLILGVHPYLQQAEIKKRFTPLADYLSSELGIPVEVRVGQSYEVHVKAIEQGEVDIAYLGPSLYVQLAQTFGRKPLLARLEANGEPTFQGHIVVGPTCKASSLDDLRGKVFAFGDPQSTMSTLVPRALLKQHDITLADLESYRHYKGHANVALAVLAGDADAGAVKEEVYHQFADRGLRSLQSTPPISEHVFVARAGMTSSFTERLQELLLSIRSPEQVSALLKPIKKSATGLVNARSSDYDNLRALIDILQE